MNPDFIQLIHTIKTTHGEASFFNARLLRSLLADYAKGSYKGECCNFLLALEDGLVERMQSEPDVSEAFLRTQASFFAFTYSLTKDAAQFVVSGWAEVLGLHINGKPVLLQNASGAVSTSSIQEGQGQASPVTHATSPHTAVFTGKTYTNSIGMEFVLIPGGSFMMGSPDSDENACDDEKPCHPVTLSKSFYLGKFPVTQAQWIAVMGTNPSHFYGRDLPVDNVSWDDAQEFIEKLNKRESMIRYRLPTEAEWEYAARAGSTTAWCFGNDDGQLRQYTWYRNNSDKQPHPVGQKKPNAWGLYDMHGNVWEWVRDWHGDYPTGNMTDPAGPSSGKYRVLRGGGWYLYEKYCRSAHRNCYSPTCRNESNGFRLAFFQKFEAIQCCRRAAERGDVNAQFNMGLMYAKGDGVAQNDSEAAKWFRMAANQGHTEAKDILGIKLR